MKYMDDFLPEGYEQETANNGMDPFKAGILQEIRTGIIKISALDPSIIQPKPTGFIPQDPFVFDLSAIARSGKKNDVLDFLQRWQVRIISKIEGSMYFAGKHILLEEVFEDYDSIEWEELPAAHQQHILMIELKEWLDKLIIDLTAETGVHLSDPIQESKGGSTARQVLIMHFIFKYLQVRDVDQTKKANLIHFLTGKDKKNIYDAVRDPLSTKTGEFRKSDLQNIRPFFEDLGLVEIVKMINNELEQPTE